MASISAILNSEGWYINLLTKLGINNKPLSCPLCLSFWLTLIWGQLFTSQPFLYLIMGGFISAIIGELIFRKLNNILWQNKKHKYGS